MTKIENQQRKISIRQSMALTGSIFFAGLALAFGADQETQPVTAAIDAQKEGVPTVTVGPYILPDTLATQVSDLRIAVSTLQVAPPNKEVVTVIVPFPVVIPPPSPSPDVVVISPNAFNEVIDKGVSIRLTAIAEATARAPSPTPVVVREIFREPATEEQRLCLPLPANSWAPLLIAAGLGFLAGTAFGRRIIVRPIRRSWIWIRTTTGHPPAPPTPPPAGP